MAEVVLNLGTVTIPDNAVDSGLLTQQDLKDWLDTQFDTENAGGNYVARMTRAVRILGIKGISSRTSHFKLSNARKAAGVVQGGLTTESE